MGDQRMGPYPLLFFAMLSGWQVATLESATMTVQVATTMRDSAYVLKEIQRKM